MRFALNRRQMFGLALGQVVCLSSAAMRAPAQAADPSVAVRLAQQLCDALLAVMHVGRNAPFEQRFNQLAPVIDRIFDLDTILQVSVGPAWAALPADQKALLQTAFRRYTVASYVNSFDNFTGQRFEVSPQPRSLPNGDAVAETRIIPRSGDPHMLNYVMRQRGDAWRVVDVLADGSISRVAVQRSDFRRLLNSGGAAALAQSLQQKTTDLSGGANG